MADDILLDHRIADNEKSSSETILDKPTVQTADKETELPLPAQSTNEDVDDNLISDAHSDDGHGVANVVAAIDAFLAEPHDLGEESQTESHNGHDDYHIEAEADEHSTVAEENVENACHSDAHSENDLEEQHGEPLLTVVVSDLSIKVEDKSIEETEESAPVEAENDTVETHIDEEEQNTLHTIESTKETEDAQEEETDESVHEVVDDGEPSQHPQDEEHEEHSFVEHDEANVSMAESTDPTHNEGTEAAHGEKETQEEEHYEYSTVHDSVHENEDAFRRSSASSSRSAVSDRRTSLRTEALIQAAARAVVAKINEKNSTDAHFDIMSAISEPNEDQQDEGGPHPATDEDGENDHEQDADFDDDDVFSDRSPRSSLGSFEHNSGVSNHGADEDHRKKDFVVTEDTESHIGSEDEHDYVDETGSIAYHGHQNQEDRHRSPRLSTVSGISRMSQYEQHHEQDEDEYDDGEDFAPHTIRGTQRAAFRTPSSVRAIQMSSPSPSVIFGVSPRSAARRRRLGTSSGLDDGQSMGSVGTYASLPGSPSKKHTPTRFKVFRKPEPAPLVLLHATLMPTRWVWSDVLRTLDERLSSTGNKSGKDVISVSDIEHTDVASFEPSAALKRLHGAWCQLQEYSLGADTVAERGVLLPHPQNDYEVLEERLLEALELPVRRRARILECGHYLGPADDEDEDDYDSEDDDYYNGRSSYREECDTPNKRHWCSTCRSDIRYESLGAERVFRVKVYASNGLMTVGAWAACWSEMERVDVEIEPIVADAALMRELNQLRTLQQQETLQKQEEEEAAAEDMNLEDDEHEIHDEHDDLLHEDDDHHEHMDYLEHEEIMSPPAPVGHFHLAPPSNIPVSPPLRESPVEPPAITTTDRVSDAERRQREAEERLREIYGRTPPQAIPSAVPTSHSHRLETRLSDVPETVETTATRDIDSRHSPFGPSPPSPSAEAYERREERRSRQFSSSDRGFHNGSAGHASSSGTGEYSHQPQAPYDSASLPELLLAAGKVFLRDRKHVAITVLSIIVILLATLRSPGAAVDNVTAVSGDNVESVQSQVVDAHPGVDYRLARDSGANVAQKGAEVVSDSVVDEIAKSVASMDTLIETVVEKMTVKVYETVTETATETSTETSTAITTEVAATTAVLDIYDTEATETVTVEAVESAEPVEPKLVSVEEEPSASTSVSSLAAEVEAASVFTVTDASTSAAEPTLVENDAGLRDEL
ncbi:hypothetical protein SEUCBS139899_000649 [Sporothrix eucalyptigena]